MKFDPQQLQYDYETWCNLMERIQQSTQQLRDAELLWRTLQNYYHSPQWLEDHDSDLRLACSPNHYSILGQDTLWNSLDERRQLALTLMRLGLTILEDR